MRILTNEEWKTLFLFMEREFTRMKTELDSFLKKNRDWEAKLELSNYPPAVDIAFWLKPSTKHYRRNTIQLDSFTGERAVRIKEEEMHAPADFLGRILTPLLKAVITPAIVRQNLKNTYTLKYRIELNYPRILVNPETNKIPE